MKLYLYCLIDHDASVESVIFSGPREGISGSLVTLYCPGDFALLVSDFAGGSVPVTRENVLKHAAVVGSLLPETTPLPFRFGTLATEAELDSYLNARSKALLAKFDLVRGCVEMGVKVIWDRQWSEEASSDDILKPGTAFLKEKRREILGSAARSEEAKRIARWLEERLGDVVRQTELKTDFTSKLLVTAAHLVPRESVDEYRARMKNVQLERPELHFLVSGPWPPYSFANIDLEFKTQFGVS
jgi:hypothetical protein